MTRLALVRPPGDSFVHAISSRQAAIDVSLARAQHAEYCQALTAAGVQVESLAPDELFPDSCFMQDPAIEIGGLVVICRLAAHTRQGEEAALVPLLSRVYPLERILAPGTLEGGDILVLPGGVLVGLSGRSNAAGVAQLDRALTAQSLRTSGERPMPVSGIDVRGYLHLLSAVTYLGHNTVLAVEAFSHLPELSELRVLVVPDDEEYACNALGIDGRVIFPAGHPKTTAMLRAEGFEVLETPVTEFAKADGGVTCLSLMLPVAPKLAERPSWLSAS